MLTCIAICCVIGDVRKYTYIRVCKSSQNALVTLSSGQNRIYIYITPPSGQHHLQGNTTDRYILTYTRQKMVCFSVKYIILLWKVFSGSVISHCDTSFQYQKLLMLIFC